MEDKFRGLPPSFILKILGYLVLATSVYVTVLLVFVESENVGNGESKHSSASFPPLQISGGVTNTSKQRMAPNSGGGGGRRVRWAEEEVEFLKEGVSRFGIGNWKIIRDNYPFNSKRSNVDLRDKWRNMQK